MRALAAVALCFPLGACAMFGGGGTDIYGVYDMVSIGGESLPNAELTSAWLDWRPDGSWTNTYFPVGAPEPMTEEGQSSLGEEADGCVPFEAWGSLTPDQPFSGTVCDGVISGTDPEAGTFVMHKRR